MQSVENISRDNLVSDKTEYLTMSWPAGKLHDTIFPYAVVRVAFGVYAPIAIPGELVTDGDKARWVAAFAAQQNLRVCFVLSQYVGVYYNAKGEFEDGKSPPSGGSVINWEAFLDGRIIKKTDESKTTFTAHKPDGTFEMILTKTEKNS